VAAVLTISADVAPVLDLLLERFTHVADAPGGVSSKSRSWPWIQSLGGKLYLRDVWMQSSIARSSVPDREGAGSAQ